MWLQPHCADEFEGENKCDCAATCSRREDRLFKGMMIDDAARCVCTVRGASGMTLDAGILNAKKHPSVAISIRYRNIRILKQRQ